MIATLLILFGLYFICMLTLVLGFRRISTFDGIMNVPTTHFSLVIPFRNEAENLPSILKSISNLNYPPNLYEVLFVNDDSEDGSEEIIFHHIQKGEISIQLIQNKRLSNSPKKDAITEAIYHSKFAWIVTTDADCELPKNWLKTLDAFIQVQSQKGSKNETVMVCGPVIYKSDNSFIQYFQQMDGFSLQTVTIGSFGLKIPILSNGANLAYRKDAFLAVNGFSGNNHIASGDDIFLMEKIKKAFPQGIKFLKSLDALVSTKPQHSWGKIINQRIRWASKTSKQKSLISIFLGILVVLINLSFLLIPCAIVFDFQNVLFYLFILLIKILSDLMVIQHSASFFGRGISLRKFLALPFAYATIVIIVFFRSLIGKYSWKGRAF